MGRCGPQGSAISQVTYSEYTIQGFEPGAARSPATSNEKKCGEGLPLSWYRLRWRWRYAWKVLLDASVSICAMGATVKSIAPLQLKWVLLQTALAVQG